MGPNYKEPKQQITKHWDTNHSSVHEGKIKTQHWWTVFHDPVLTRLIQEGYHHNLSLQSTGVRVLQARAQLAQSVGSLYPQQQAATGNYTHYRIGGSSLQGLLPPNFETASLGFSASWELDFWGKYRRAILSNDAAFLASFAAYDHALVTLTSDIANAYIQFRTTQVQIQIVEANIKVQAMGLQLARSRYTAGQTSLVDVEQAQTELSQTEATLPSLRTNLQRQKDALAVLLGTTPEGIQPFLQKKGTIPKAPPKIGVGIPKESLAKRPDIYQARMQAIAQSESIGAAKANLFPSFSLNGTFEFSANTINGASLGDLFNWSNRNVTAGPSFVWPILNYGQITNAVRQQDAVFQQALLNYMNVVLKAQQEVQDNITSFIEAKKAEATLLTANSSVTKSLQLALIRYKEGETDFTPVLNAEQQQLRVQTSLVNAQGDVPNALVALYRALGGGWDLRCGHDVVNNGIKHEMENRTNWGALLDPEAHMPPQTPGQATKQLYLPNW